MSYDIYLSRAFPWCWEVTEEEARDAINRLIDTTPADGTPVPNGTSFAVTSDARDGYRKLWLSHWSYVKLGAEYTKEADGE